MPVAVNLDGIRFRADETPIPEVSFVATPDHGSTPLFVQFTDTSTNSPTSWHWDFGDGTTSTLQNPTHTFSSAGVYTVTLTATNAFGSGTATGLILVGPKARFSGTPNPGVDPYTVTFTDQSIGTITAWHWNFGDGATSTAQNPVHTFPTGRATYTVTLTVTDSNGLSDTVSHAFTDNAVVAEFSAAPVSGPDPFTVTFTDLSQGNIVSWAWTFGDGGTSAAQNPVHTYPAGAANYTVTLIVTDAYGDTDSVSHTVTDTGSTVATQVLVASRAGAASTSALYLIDAATGAATSIGAIGYALTGLAWDPTTHTLFGITSNNSVNPKTFIKVDPATGTGTIIGATGLTAFSNLGDICVDATGHVFGIETGIPHKLASVDKATGHATDVGPPGGYGTTFGCGLDFSPGGTLYAFINGDTGNVRTIDPVTGAATLGPALSGFSQGDAAISAASFDAGGVLYAIDNNFGAPVHLVTIDPTTGIITDVGATLDTPPLDALAWIPALSAKFTAARSGGPFDISFADHSYVIGAAITGWAWTFGDGGTSTLQNPSHTYLAAGTYTVTLTVTDSLGRTDSFSQSVHAPIGKILKANSSSGTDAYAFKNLGVLATPWYGEFCFYIPQATIDGLHFDFGAELIDFNDSFFLSRDAGVWRYWTEFANTGPQGTFVADQWHTVSFSNDGTTVTWKVDGVTLFSYPRSFAIATSWDLGARFNDFDAAIYIDNFKVGTTPGGSDIFSDDFESGGFSNWTGTSGAVSIVTDDVIGGGC